MGKVAALVLFTLAGCAQPKPIYVGPWPPPIAPALVTRRIDADGRAAAEVCRSPFARQFLDGAADLPAISPRTLYHDKAKTRFYREADALRLPEPERAQLVKQIADEGLYYTTRYGSPIAYCRALELAEPCAPGVACADAVAGKRVLDFGYGAVGHLRMLASLGAEVVGVDVDPLLPVIYGEPGDTGKVGPGSVTLVNGHFPGDPAVRAQVGGGYHLILAKNTLKEGYVHPVKPDPRYAIGVDDGSFVRALYDALAPEGRVMIYNLAPAANGAGKPYRSWADAPLPFPKELLEAAGFRVLVYDRDDSETARKLGHALKWDLPDGDDPAMDLKNDLFARYTLLEKP